MERLRGSVLIAVACLVAGLADPSHGALISGVNDGTDGDFASVPAGFDTQHGYDALNVTVTGTPGEVVPGLRFTVNFPAKWDDSIALDFDGDGTVDLAVRHGDLETAEETAKADPGAIFSPWNDQDDRDHAIVIATITPAGTSARVEVYGTAAVLTAPSFDGISGITLADIGFDPGGAIPAGGSATTADLRFGIINGDGPGSNHNDLTAGGPNVSVSLVPEPTSAGLMLVGTAAVAALGRRPTRRRARGRRKGP